MLVAAAAMTGPAGAALKQTDADTWKDDFDTPALTGWQANPTFVPERDGDRTVLRAGGPAREEQERARLAYALADVDLDDYAVECAIRKAAGNWAGLVFRSGTNGTLEVVFTEDGRLMLRRQPQCEVLARAAVPADKEPYRRLRVVGLGPVIRVYVDGQKVAQVRDEGLLRGKPGLFAHFTHAFFDGFEVSRKLRPEESVLIGPADPRDALLVPPAKPATIALSVWNAFAQPKTLTLRWELPSRSAEGPTPATASATNQQVLSVEPRRSTVAQLSLPPLPDGLTRLAVAVLDGDRELERLLMPVAAVTPPDVAPEEPFFPFAVYDKYALGGEPWFRNTYLHAVCADLRRHGCNTILTGGLLAPPTKAQLDIVARYGMKVVLRVDNAVPNEVADHPAVLTFLIGDEPTLANVADYQRRYIEIRKQHPGRKLTTNVIGETIGTAGENDAWLVLPKLDPDTVLVRYYPIRKSAYDLIRTLTYKGWMPPNAVFRLISVAAGEKPWWYVAQTFGHHITPERPEPYWRNPTGAELTGMLHLALAHGARGLFFYTYQSEGKDVPSLVAQEDLRPTDDKYEALSRFARQIAPARAALLSAKWSGQEVRAEPPTIEAIGRETADGRKLVYLVNRDTVRAAEGRVTILSAVSAATDLFSGQTTAFSSAAQVSVATVNLPPGAGCLWELRLPPAASRP